MKRTVKSAVVVAAAMAMATSACSSGSSSSGGGISTDGKGKTVTVWLMSDAQKGWPDVVNQANARFEKETGAKVKVEWQQWSNYTTKLDSTFAGSTGIPDAVELGNTQTASYISAGAFADLSKDKKSFENSDTWLKALSCPARRPKASCRPSPTTRAAGSSSTARTSGTRPASRHRPPRSTS